MIVLINPNATVSMTDSMVATARACAPWANIVGITSEQGPASIQGRADGTAAVPPLLTKIEQACRDGAQAIIIACFDDTGLQDARRIATCPVIGIGQAAYHWAALTGDRFSVVTTLDVSVPILTENIAAYGLTNQCGRVRASGVPVLDLERDPDAATQQVLREIQQAEHEDNIDTIVLGCGGMVDLPDIVRAHTGLRPIDGVRAATWVCAGLVSEG